MEFYVVVTQDDTGSRTLAYGALYLFPGNAHTLTTTANAVDVIHCLYDGTNILCELTKAYA
jgi:hypothetical protein